MAGANHTGRRPSRLSSIGRRDARAAGDRRRVYEADIRSSIYVRPRGPEYDVVKNVCNDQEYVVANATGSTHSAGQVVPLGSFSGQPGEFSFGRPPAGMGGASGYGIQRVSAGYGYSTEAGGGSSASVSGWGSISVETADYLSDKALWVVAGDRGSGQELLLISVPLSSLPLTLAGATAICTVIGSFGPADDTLSALALWVTPGPYYICLFQIDAMVGTNDSQGFLIKSMNAVGDVVATTDSWIGPDSQFWGGDGQASFDVCISGGALYAIEPREEDPVYSSPPEPTGRRVTKRNPGSLALLAEYDLPSVAPYNGQTYVGMVARDGGGVSLYYKNWTSAVDWNLWRRDLSSSLSVVGSDTMFSNVGKDEDYSVGNPRSFCRIGATTFCVGGIPGEATVCLFTVGASTFTLVTDALTVRPKFVERSNSGPLVAFTSSGGSAWLIDQDGTEHYF